MNGQTWRQTDRWIISVEILFCSWSNMHTLYINKNHKAFKIRLKDKLSLSLTSLTDLYSQRSQGMMGNLTFRSEQCVIRKFPLTLLSTCFLLFRNVLLWTLTLCWFYDGCFDVLKQITCEGAFDVPRHTCVLHVLLWRFIPEQGGVRQTRLRLWDPPPQLTEHTDHADQSNHGPESKTNTVTKQICQSSWNQMYCQKRRRNQSHLCSYERYTLSAVHLTLSTVCLLPEGRGYHTDVTVF